MRNALLVQLLKNTLKNLNKDKIQKVVVDKFHTLNAQENLTYGKKLTACIMAPSTASDHTQFSTLTICHQIITMQLDFTLQITRRLITMDMATIFIIKSTTITLKVQMPPSHKCQKN